MTNLSSAIRSLFENFRDAEHVLPMDLSANRVFLPVARHDDFTLALHGNEDGDLNAATPPPNYFSFGLFQGKKGIELHKHGLANISFARFPLNKTSYFFFLKNNEHPLIPELGATALLYAAREAVIKGSNLVFSFCGKYWKEDDIAQVMGLAALHVRDGVKLPSFEKWQRTQPKVVSTFRVGRRQLPAIQSAWPMEPREEQRMRFWWGSEMMRRIVEDFLSKDNLKMIEPPYTYSSHQEDVRTIYVGVSPVRIGTGTEASVYPGLFKPLERFKEAERVAVVGAGYEHGESYEPDLAAAFFKNAEVDVYEGNGTALKVLRNPNRHISIDRVIEEARDRFEDVFTLTPVEDRYPIPESVVRRVKLHPHNLFTTPLPGGKKYKVIICRNTSYYMKSQHPVYQEMFQRAFFYHILDALEDDGVVLIGAADVKTFTREEQEALGIEVKRYMYGSNGAFFVVRKMDSGTALLKELSDSYRDQLSKFKYEEEFGGSFSGDPAKNILQLEVPTAPRNFTKSRQRLSRVRFSSAARMSQGLVARVGV